MNNIVGCDHCGEVPDDYMDFAYIGPADRDSKYCDPMMQIQHLCTDCYEEDE